MNLQDVFDSLNNAELSQMAISQNNEESITEDGRARLIPLIQAGLNKLYARFRLKEGHFTVILNPNINQYHLISKNILSDIETNINNYLVVDPNSNYLDDLIKVENIWDQYDNRIPLNKAGNIFSVSTPKTKILNVPNILQEKQNDREAVTEIKVLYLATHEKVDKYMGMYNSFNVELELPDMFLDALCFYVASRIMNPVGMVADFHAGNSYSAKYEMECQRLENQNISIDNLSQQDRFDNNGFI